MSSLIEMLCVLAGKIGFDYNLHAMENLFFNLAVNLLYFSFKLSKFVRYF